MFVKPARGSANISISKVYDKETVDLLIAHEDGLMLQEFQNGQKIGSDVYIDMISGEVVSNFTKKIKMYAGETDKAVSFKNQRLFCLIERFVGEAGYRGQIDIGDYSSLAPTNHLLYEAALWGCANGYKTFYLVSGVGSGEDSLFRFKRAFYKGDSYRFHIARKVFEPDVYQDLTMMRADSITNVNFFPVYRG